MTGMEPKLSSPESQPGGVPQPPERLDTSERSHEDVPRLNPERREQVPAQERPSEPTQVVEPASIALPTPVAPPADDTAVVTEDDLPVAAADDDLIEKEWVDKAKKIIADTKDDPARREKEVGRLQVDYLKKRYGKELGAAD